MIIISIPESLRGNCNSNSRTHSFDVQWDKSLSHLTCCQHVLHCVLFLHPSGNFQTVPAFPGYLLCFFEEFMALSHPIPLPSAELSDLPLIHPRLGQAELLSSSGLCARRCQLLAPSPLSLSTSSATVSFILLSTLPAAPWTSSSL